MGTLSQSVDYHFETGLVTIKARGVLDVPGASALRATMLKWLAEHPLCLIVDLSQVEVADAIALTVLPAVAKRDEAAPILVVVDSSTQTGLVIEQHLRTRISVFRDEASAAQAALAGETGSRRRLHMHMWSDKSAPARARALIADACKAWGVPHLSDAAQLIISELVTNAALHTRGDFEVTVALGLHHLHLHVNDRDSRIPRLFSENSPQPEHSRGMKLVDGLASGWGTTLRPYGKSVWATLRIKQRDRVPSP